MPSQTQEAPSQSEVNSEAYWSSRFAGDWDAKGGPEQTRFFYQLALELLPPWLMRAARSERLSFCDWGCATGDGTDILAQKFDGPVTGIDFAGPAIDQARQLYKRPEFLAVDLTKETIGERYDILFCSNTLEHFVDPWAVLAKVSVYAAQALVILVPFREYQRHHEHEATFDLPMMPALVAGRFHLVNARVADTAAREPTHWPGEQILLVYATRETIDRHALSLDDIALATEPTRVEATVRSIEGNLQALRREIDRQRRAETVHAGAKLLELEESLRVSRQEQARHEGANVAIQSELSVLRAKISEEEAARREASEALVRQGAERDGLFADIERLRAKLAEDESAGRAAREALVRREAETQGLSAEIERLRARLAEEETAGRTTREALVRHAAEREGLSAEVGRLRTTLAEEHAAGRRASEALRRRGAEIDGLAADIERLRAKLAEEESAGRVASETLVRRAAESHGLSAEIERLRTKLTEAEAAGEALVRREAEMRDLSAELVQLSDTLHAMRESLAVREAQVADMHHSHSWRATAPLRWTGTGVRTGVGGAKRAGFLSIRAIYRALPLSPSAKQKFRGFVSRRTRLFSGFEASRTHPLAVEAVDAAEPPVRLDKPDVFVWAIIDWHFRIQRPQHIARAFARRGHRTFYFSGHFIDAAEPGFRTEPLSEDGSLQIVYLQVPGAPAIYFGMPSAETQAAIFASLALFLRWAEPREILSLVQHPFWKPFAERVPNRKVIYDLMDHHEGFGDNAADVIAAEHVLLREADHVIVTSTFLEDIARKSNPRVSMVRNAGEYAHFARRPSEIYRDERGRRIIGYYGAIAEWFDLDLVERIARERPDDCLLLIGADTAQANKRLAGLPNVLMAGEVSYSELPFYLYAFDVCILPFRVIPLTLATNPVKVYEYLSAGKPVVSVDLPEISQFGGLVARARTHDEFMEQLTDALDRAGEAPAEASRRRFASEQTWDHRVKAFAEALEETRSPRASVVVVTYNNLAFTQACLFGLERDTAYDDFEIIVVDNASSDGTPDYLKEWEAAGPNRTVILNAENRGFAAANNQGLARATGEYLVLLNNDTFVTPGWLGTLVAHLKRDPLLALVGPVTNNIGNEARIEIHYATMEEMRKAALVYTAQRLGRLHPSANVAFFCVAFDRGTYEAIGDLDEDFGVGFFEDDDYCRRAEALGRHVAIADDVFVHHHLSASFDALSADRKRALFETNKVIYEAKWGPWTPHQYRVETR